MTDAYTHNHQLSQMNVFHQNSFFLNHSVHKVYDSLHLFDINNIILKVMTRLCMGF